MLLAQDLWRPVKNDDLRRMILTGIRDMVRDINSFAEINIRWLRVLGVIPVLLALLQESSLDRVVREDAANVLYLVMNSGLGAPELKVVCDTALSNLSAGNTASVAVCRHLLLGVLARLAVSPASARILEDFVLKQLGAEWPLLFMADGLDEATVVAALRFLGALLRDANGPYAQRFRAASGGFAALAPALAPHVCSSEVRYSWSVVGYALNNWQHLFLFDAGGWWFKKKWLGENGRVR